MREILQYKICTTNIVRVIIRYVIYYLPYYVCPLQALPKQKKIRILMVGKNTEEMNYILTK